MLVVFATKIAEPFYHTIDYEEPVIYFFTV